MSFSPIPTATNLIDPEDELSKSLFLDLHRSQKRDWEQEFLDQLAQDLELADLPRDGTSSLLGTPILPMQVVNSTPLAESRTSAINQRSESLAPSTFKVF